MGKPEVGQARAGMGARQHFDTGRSIRSSAVSG
jgi:hypothetical protein